jgi:hypothetical protein
MLGGMRVEPDRKAHRGGGQSTDDPCRHERSTKSAGWLFDTTTRIGKTAACDDLGRRETITPPSPNKPLPQDFRADAFAAAFATATRALRIGPELPASDVVAHEGPAVGGGTIVTSALDIKRIYAYIGGNV